MGEGPWDEWNGTDSLLERLVNGTSARLEGTGVLELEDEEGNSEFQMLEGPGEVSFALLCDFEGFKSPSMEDSIKVRLVSCDDAAFSVIRGASIEGFSLLPRYRLSGSISTEEGEIPVRLNAVTLDARTPAPISATKREIRRVASVGMVTIGSLESTKDLITCKLVVPNFVEEQAVVEGKGVRISLKEISSEATHSLYAAESQGKFLPGSYLEVQRLQEDAGANIALAVDDFGWLLSFYAGRRIHPVAWEGETDSGTVWRIQNTQLLTPLGEDQPESCLSSVVSLQHFLQHSWRAWQSFNEQRRLRVRGATNSYVDILTATFATQTLALVTMYLERFRETFVGGSELLEGSGSKKNKVARELRQALRRAIDSSERLNDSEKNTLCESLRKNPGKVNDLFRKSFRESLLELYGMLGLNIDEEQLARFIRERDVVLHGSWDSGREGTLGTYRLAQYGLHLLEVLLLRLFEYEGEYHNRVTQTAEDFSEALTRQ